MSPEPRHILVADDHPLFRQALITALTPAFGDSVFAEAGNLEQVLALLDSGPALDLVLLDLRMPGAFGFSGLSFLRGRYPETPVAVVSGVDDPDAVHQSIALGASGYIPKSTESGQIVTAIQEIMTGAVWIPETVRQAPVQSQAPEERDIAARIADLSPQQFTVLNLIAEGLLNKQIAHELDLSISTVKGHTTAILKKLGLQRRTQILAAIARLNLQEVPVAEPEGR